MTLDGDAVVIAHEAVATAWPRLDAWLEEDAESARTLRAVESAAAAWQAGDAMTTTCRVARGCTARSTGGTRHTPI